MSRIIQDSVCRDLRIHINNLQDLTWHERMIYLNESFARGLLRLSRIKFLGKAIPLKKVIGKNHIKASMKASRNYFPDPPYPGAITIFKVTDEPWYVKWDRMKGWHSIVQGGVKIIPVTGNHANIMKEPFVNELASSLQTEIEKVL